ncbi:MAG: hypothetical protein ACI4ED_08285 [Suilimivivens sp.]
MKRAKKILSLMISIAMMIGMIAFDFPITAQAAEKVAKEFVLKLSVAGGTTVPGNYNVEYEVVDADGKSVLKPEDYSGDYSGLLSGSADGSEVSKTVSLDVDNDKYIKIKVTSAGNDIFINGADETSAWSEGKTIAVNDLAPEYQFQLQAHQGQNPPEEGGDDNPPADNQQSVNLTVSWSGDFGEIKVGGTSVDLKNSSQHFETVNCQQDDTILITIQANPTEVYSSIKINGEEKLSEGETKEYYEFSIPETDTELSIVVEKGESTQHTIIWRYDNLQGDDAMVEHGTVEIVSGYVSGDDGHYLVNNDAEVTIRLIPDYGYQVVGAKINGDVDLTANDSTNEFKFKMPHTNVHFQGIFTKTEDIVSVNAQGVSGASLTNGDAVAGSGGTAKMTISSASPSDISDIEGVDENKAVQAVDIQMDQLFYKNSADDLWTQPQHELSSSAEVKLVVDQPAAGYAVLREHDSQVEQIPAYYDEATGTVTFASNKYSVFTLVPLTESNNQYTPIEVSPDVPDESESETSSEESDGPAVLKTSGDTSDNTYFAIEQQEINRNPETIIIDSMGVDKTGLELMPKQTYNLSSFVTAKGFMTSIDKIAKSRQGETSISIYTEQPICFTREILKSMTKNNIDFVYYFKHEGHLYSVTVPAEVDLETIFKNNKYAGPLYLGYVLGTSKLIK